MTHPASDINYDDAAFQKFATVTGDTTTDTQKLVNVSSSESDRRLDRLLAYTTFHIGMYATIFAGIVAYLKLSDVPYGTVSLFLRFSSVALLIAGAAGGIIAGHLPHYRNYESFMAAEFAPRVLEQLGCTDRWSYNQLSMVEHSSFWCVIITILLLLLLS